MSPWFVRCRLVNQGERVGGMVGVWAPLLPQVLYGGSIRRCVGFLLDSAFWVGRWIRGLVWEVSVVLHGLCLVRV